LIIQTNIHINIFGFYEDEPSIGEAYAATKGKAFINPHKSNHKGFIMKWITSIKERIEKIINSIKLTFDLFIEWMHMADHNQMIIDSTKRAVIYSITDIILLLLIANALGYTITLGIMAYITAEAMILATLSGIIYIYAKSFREWIMGEYIEDEIDEERTNDELETLAEAMDLIDNGEEDKLTPEMKRLLHNAQSKIHQAKPMKGA
jgi:hypothetical protein